MSESRSDDDDEPLTKTKLFTLSEDGSWTEMGVGVAACCEDEDNGEPILRLDIVTIPEPGEAAGEVLLSTPVSLEDIYSVQKGSILVWCDPELGRDMAASFHSKEGCSKVIDDIRAFQAGHRKRRAELAVAASAAPAPLHDDSNGDVESPWSVRRAHLPTIAAAFHDNRLRIGTHMRGNRDFVFDLCTLFQGLRGEEGDAAAAATQHLCNIVMAILSLFGGDAQILSQIVEDRSIDTVVDIVQFAVGRRTKETGFVSKAERHAMFRDPVRLPPTLVHKAHSFFAVQFLRDLVPHLLDEEPMAQASSLISNLLIRARHNMLSDIMCSSNILQRALATDGDAQQMRGVAALLNDITTHVKNTTAIGAEVKTDVFSRMIELGAVGFLRRLLRAELGMTEGRCGTVIQQAADCLSHLTLWAPVQTYRRLLDEADTVATEGPTTIFLCLSGIATVDEAVPSQALVDAAQAVCIGMQQLNIVAQMFGREAVNLRRRLLQYVVKGHGSSVSVADVPIYVLLAAIAKAMDAVSGDASSGARAQSGASQSIYNSLRILRVLVHDRAIGASNAFADLLRASDLLTAATRALRHLPPKIAAPTVELLAELVQSNTALLQRLIITSGVLVPLTQLHGSLHRRPNVLSAAVLSVFTAAHATVTEAQRLRTSLSTSPFLSRLREPEDDSGGAAEGDTALLEHINSECAPFLAHAAPLCLAKIRAVVSGAPTEDDSCSIPQSHSESRVMPDSEFQALLVEYGTGSAASSAALDTGVVLSSVPDYDDEPTVPEEEAAELRLAMPSSSDDNTADNSDDLPDSPVPRAATPAAAVPSMKTQRDDDLDSLAEAESGAVEDETGAPPRKATRSEEGIHVHVTTQGVAPVDPLLTVPESEHQSEHINGSGVGADATAPAS